MKLAAIAVALLGLAAASPADASPALMRMGTAQRQLLQVASGEARALQTSSCDGENDITSDCCDGCFSFVLQTSTTGEDECPGSSTCDIDTSGGLVTCTCGTPAWVIGVAVGIVVVQYVIAGVLAFFILKKLQAKEAHVPEGQKVIDDSAKCAVVGLTLCLGCLGALLAYVLYNGKVDTANNNRMMMQAHSMQAK